MTDAFILWLMAVAFLAGAAGAFFGAGWGLLVAGILLACTAVAAVPPRRKPSGKQPNPPMWTSSGPVRRGRSY